MTLAQTLPHHYSRRILLAVAANSPQIVTETLYALAHLQPVWLPTELHIITTQAGAEHVQAGLCTANQLGRLCADYALPYPTFDTSHIHIISDAQGKPLSDVRSDSDSAHAADFISNKVREFTADEQCSLHVSLSGGRRTMTYYIGYALSLFGRAQDRLSHVVVDSEYFFNQAFYYPPPKPIWVVRDDGTGFDAATVDVTLSDIPFLRLREGLPKDLLAGNATFSGTISAAQQRFNPAEIHFNSTNNALVCGGVKVNMPPAQLTFYVWMLQRRVQGLPPVHWTDVESVPLIQQYWQLHYRLFGATNSYLNSKNKQMRDMSKTWFDERKSHTNKCLKQALGEQLAHDYLIHPHGKRPQTRFGIHLAPAALHL